MRELANSDWPVRNIQPHPASDVHPFSVAHGHFDLIGEGSGPETSVEECEQDMGSRLSREVSRIGGKALRYVNQTRDE